MTPLIAGIELGGTKSIAVLTRGGAVLDRLQVSTTHPAPTIAALIDRVATWHAVEALAAIGIASFGPIVLDRRNAAFGSIGNTPKPYWSGADVQGSFVRVFPIPIGFDTDVAGAALGEGRWGAARGCADHVYMTVGTGVGVGIVAGGQVVHGAGHPEVGHIRVRRVAGDPFRGACPFHGDCLEGLIAGPALAARTGLAGDAIPPDHPVWSNVAAELAEAMAFLILTLAPQRIVVGGGVMSHRPELLPHIQRRTAELIANYVSGYDAATLARMIVVPELGDNAGPIGAAELGYRAWISDPQAAESLPS